MKFIYTFLFSLLVYTFSFGQDNGLAKPVKVKHAEPLYLDLMRDLGARKGEAEFNIGYGSGRYKNKVAHHAFIEYEWAVAHRLGLEVEVPVQFVKGDLGHSTNRVEGVKLGTQYTFSVDEQRQTSLAVGYVHEMEFGQRHASSRSSPFFEGFIASPFFIAAKNFNHISTLIYTGPEFEYHFKNKGMQTNLVFNANVHYMVPHSNHYIGIENDMRIDHDQFEYILRPQIKISLSNNFAVGMVCGVPIKAEEFQMDFMTRLIWEPKF